MRPIKSMNSITTPFVILNGEAAKCTVGIVGAVWRRRGTEKNSCFLLEFDWWNNSMLPRALWVLERYRRSEFNRDSCNCPDPPAFVWVLRTRWFQCWRATKGEVKSGPARSGRLQRICGYRPKRTVATWKVPTSLTFKTSMPDVPAIRGWHRESDICTSASRARSTLSMGGWKWICSPRFRIPTCLLQLSLDRRDGPPPPTDTWRTCSICRQHN